MGLAHTFFFWVHNTHFAILRSQENMASRRSCRGLLAILNDPPVDKLRLYSNLRLKQLPVVKNK